MYKKVCNKGGHNNFRKGKVGHEAKKVGKHCPSTDRFGIQEFCIMFR